MNQEVSLADLFEGRLECLDETRRQLLYETDGVAQQHCLPARQLELARGGIKGGKQAILDNYVGPGESIEQR